MKQQVRYAISPWERYMMIDHSAKHTMTCFQRFWFRSILDREAFTNSVREVARRNPMMQMEADGNWWKPLEFDPEKQIDWKSGPVELSHEHLPVDDFRVHFWVRTGKLHDLGLDGDPHEGTLLVLIFNHCVMDGKASLALVQQISDVMASRSDWAPSEEDLEYRLHFGLTLAKRVARFRWDFKGSCEYFLRRCVPFGKTLWGNSGGESEDEEGQRLIRCCSAGLSREEMGSVVRMARQAGYTVNDVILSAAFRVLARWEEAGSERVSNQVIRIAVPMAMRPARNRAICNLLGMVFVDRRPSETECPDLLHGVSAEMELIKRRDMGQGIISVLSLACMGQGKVIRHILQRQEAATTAIVTNLGIPYSETESLLLGDCELVALDSMAPLRPGTNLCFSVNRYQGRLVITLRYNPVVLAAADAGRLLRDLLDEIPSMLVGDELATPQRQLIEHEA